MRRSPILWSLALPGDGMAPAIRQSHEEDIPVDPRAATRLLSSNLLFPQSYMYYTVRRPGNQVFRLIRYFCLPKCLRRQMFFVESEESLRPFHDLSIVTRLKSCVTT